MSKTVTLKIDNISLDDGWDVIVAGGGPAGCTSAIAAARAGAKVLLLERTGALGGMGTMGLVPAWCPFSDGIRLVYQGLAEKVLRETMAGMPHLKPEQVNWTPIDPERLKRVYDDLVLGSGAKIRFETTVCGVAKDDAGNITALYAASKRGIEAFAAKVFVDCTGDADLAAWAGAPWEKGGADGALQAATHCFMLANVNQYSYNYEQTSGTLHSQMIKLAESGKYPLITDGHGCNSLIGPGVVGFNSGHIWNVDNTDPDNVTDAYVEGRRKAAQFRDGLAEFFPKSFAGAFVAQTAPLMGVRETRRIVGDYVLTLDDYMDRASFPDEICRNNYYVDVHRSKEEKASGRQYDYEPRRYGKGESHGVPYRCLIPKTLRNVLVAGRCISTDRPVQGSTRVMPVCLAMGEAAGTAAAMAAAAEGDVRADVNADALRATLRENGAYLP
ncbi:MAG: FAD-dependent oxidoreductase [Kiritimatiellia bacterium]